MSHLVAAYVYVLAGKQLQDLLQDSLQEGEGPLIALHQREHIRDPTVYTFSVDGPIVQPALLLNRSLDFCRCAARASWHAFWRSTTLCQRHWSISRFRGTAAHRAEDIFMHAPLHWHL